MSTVIMSGPTRNTDVCQSVVQRQGRFKSIRSDVFRRDGHQEMLLRELEINTLLPLFLRSHVLNTNELKDIKKHKIRRRRVGEFLEIMFKKDTEEWIDTVLLILEEHDHSHVVKQLQGLSEPLPPYQIRSFRPTQFQLRVLPDEQDMVRALQANPDSQLLDDAVETLEFSILNIYEGSLCFLLDPISEKAIEELWKKSKNVFKIKKFLGRILARLKTNPNFQEKRDLKVEITEIENNFVIYIDDHSGRMESVTFVEKKSSHCSGCFRKTVLGNYQSILDEVETSMMEETFKADIVPGCIKTACIDEKYKRSRLERADIFMQFALTNEKLLMAFKSIYEKSSVEPTQMYCSRHSHNVTKELVKPREITTLCFEIDCDEKDGTIVITSTSDEFRKSWPCLDPINEISMPFCHIEIENSSNSGVLDEEIRIVIVGKGCSVKREISDAILGKNVFETNSLRRRRFLSQTDAAPVISQLQRDRYVDNMFGKVFIVTTTPDFTGSPIDAMQDYTPKFLAMTSPGPHIIILAVETSSSAESVNYDEMVKPFTHVFGKSIHQYFAVILDKKKDGLFPNMFDNSPICEKLVRQGRLFYFEKQKRHRLVIDILQIVQQIRKETTEPYYSDNLFLKTEEILKQKTLEQYDNQLDKVRQHEVEIASLKAKLSFMERQQDIIKDLNTRESAIQHFDINEFKHILNI